MFGVSSENTRYVVAGVILLVWVLSKAAPHMKSAFTWTVNKAVSLWPKVSQKTNVLRAWPVIAILLVLCFPMPGSGKCPVLEPVKPADVVDQCVESNRELLGEAIKAFAGEKYETVQAAEDALNQKILDVYQASFDPLFKKINEARKAEKLVELAVQIKNGDVK
jgi:hypothetical protein